jgi:hypothetical protein
MLSKQIRLLAQANFLQRRLRRMPRQILKFVTDCLEETPGFSDEQLVEAVILQQTLHPLRVGPLKSISIDVEQSLFLSIYEVQFAAYRAEAIVPYEGSPELWSALPNKSFNWDIRGIVQRNAVRVVCVLDSKNWLEVETFVLKWLDDVQKALPDFGPSIIMYNVRLPALIRPVVLRSIEIVRARSKRQPILRR